MSKRLNLVINGKGGVGKSFFATNFVQYLKDRGIRHRAIDTDHENSTLKRFHPDAEFINLEHQRELDLIFDSLQRFDLLVVDCRAASTDLFLDYFAEIDAFDVLRSTETELTVVMPVNHEADSVEQVRLLADGLAAHCRYVIVRNEAHSEQFRIYEDSRSRQRVLNDLGGCEITMPRMHDWLVAALNANNATCTAALTHSDFTVIDRQRLKNWQRRFYEQIAVVADLLLPSAATGSTPVGKLK